MPLPAKLPEARARAVGQHPVDLEARPDLLGEVVEGGVGGARLEEARQVAASRGEEPPEGARRPQHAPDRPELLRREHPADPRPLEGLADVVHLGGREGPALPEEVRGLGRLREPVAGLVAGLGELEAEREVPAEGPGAPVGQGPKDAIPLEVGARLGGTGVGAKRVHGGRGG